MTDMNGEGGDVVACPNCSTEVAYAALNKHLDQCLELNSDDKKRPTPPKSEDGPTAKKVKVEDRTARPVAPSHHPASATASTSRERLDSVAPLAERLRPRSLADFVGQEGVVDGPLKALLQRGSIPNAILWGPPGTGKTTLARILARTTITPAGPYRFVEISATTASTNEVKKIYDEAFHRLQLTGQRTVLFIDEIQRFSRAQQDIFLPMIERGQLTLLAATTENPSFRLQGALLSRMRVFVLTKLSIEECFQVLSRARRRLEEEEEQGSLQGERAEKGEVAVEDEVLRWIATMADGDARTALGALELAIVTLSTDMSTEEKLQSLRVNLKRTSLQYDRTGDHHYDTISALHKSIRGSNPDAALYWLARMVESGDDPLFVARRLIVAASEDCGTMEALQMATATYSACQVVGLPECGENLAHCVVFLAESKKSTRAYRGWKKALALVRDSYNFPVPIHIRNAPTKLMKELGHGKEYRYEPNFAHPVHQEYFPPQLRDTRLLSPDPADDSESSDDEHHINGLDMGDHHQRKDKAAPLMASSAAVGPGSCQRLFQLGARSVDLDLLDEWERERIGGKAWSGRRKLVQQINAATPKSASLEEFDR